MYIYQALMTSEAEKIAKERETKIQNSKMRGKYR
jgi:hypothetical protein